MGLGRFHNLSLSIGSALGWRRRATAAASWGDGLADETLGNAWHRASWTEVDTDELVYLIPSLAGRRRVAASTEDFGPATVARDALGMQVFRTAYALREITGDHGDGSAEALDLIAASGVLTTIDPYTAWVEGRDGAERLCARGRASPEAFRPIDPGIGQEACVFELAVVSCLDRLHSAARGPAHRGGAAQDMPLPEALVASIHSTFNAAYVFPQLACVHEVLSVGAWLGHLVKGRPAYMPPFVAAYLEAELAPGREGDASAGGRSTRILRSHAEQAVGLERLHAVARRVASTGRPMLVKPRAMPGLGFTPYLWSAHLRSSIMRRVDAQLFA
jgi:hypothetical protein